MLFRSPSWGFFFVRRHLLQGRSVISVTGRRPGRPDGDFAMKTPRVLSAAAAAASLFILTLYLTIAAGSVVSIWGVDWSWTGDHWIYSLDVGLDTLLVTLMAALVTTPAAVFGGMLAAFLIVRLNFSGRRLLELLCLLGSALPGAAMGIGYILTFNGAPFRLSGGALILILLYVFRNLPLAVDIGTTAFRQISPRIEESSMNLGAGRLRTFRSVTLPLLKPACATALIFTFIRSMTALSAVIFLVSARWNHMTVLIFAQTEIMRLGAASVMSLVLILIILSFIALVLKAVHLRGTDVVRLQDTGVVHD